MTEATLPIADISTLSLEQLKELKEKVKAAEKTQKEAEKANREKVFNALYKCDGCTCGGFIGKAGAELMCGTGLNSGDELKDMAEVKTWQTGRQSRKKVDEGQLTIDHEPINDPEDSKPVEPGDVIE